MGDLFNTTPQQIDLMCHALGVRDRANYVAGAHGGETAWRNHFLTSRGDQRWQQLAEWGLAYSSAPGFPTCLGNDGIYYHVTDKGREAVAAARQGWEEERLRYLARQLPCTEWSRHQLWMWLLNIDAEVTARDLHEKRVEIHPALTRLTLGHIKADLRALVSDNRVQKRVVRICGAQRTCFRAETEEFGDDIPF